MAGRLLYLAAVVAVFAVSNLDALADNAALGFHVPTDYPESIRLGWGQLTKSFDESVGSGGLPVPQFVNTKVYMLDGTPLSTQILIPYPTEKRRPAVICRSPYGPSSKSMALLYTTLGFVAVMQDMRGTFFSGGISTCSVERLTMVPQLSTG